MTYTMRRFLLALHAANPLPGTFARAVICVHLSALALFCQNLTFTNRSMASGTYDASNSITADSANATTTVNSGASVTFQAGSFVKLLPNFHAYPGSYFHAVIQSPAGITVSGYITAGVCGLSPVTVNVTGSSSSATTDATGFYSLTLPGGSSYTMTPSRTNYTFTPSSYTLSASTSTANYTPATGPLVPTREYIHLGERVIAVSKCGSN